MRFRKAAEAALQLAVPHRAVWLRALLAELERLANHLGDIGAICNDASFGLMQAHCNVLREDVLRAANIAFGHRLMRDVIVPGGLVRDLDEKGQASIRAALDNIHVRFPALIELYDNTASLQDRTVGTGIVTAALAKQYAAGGYVGRASGRDLRCPPGSGLCRRMTICASRCRCSTRVTSTPASGSGFAKSSRAFPWQTRFWTGFPAARYACRSPSEAGPREGMALVEGFRGDILVWLRLDGGRIDRCHLRDPSWFQWPLLEAAIEDNIVADFPLCNKSFNCSYSGQDL